MIEILDSVLAAKNAQETSFQNIKPKLNKSISKLFIGMVERQLSEVAIRIADEDGVREFHFYCESQERYAHLYRVLITKKPMKVHPIFSVEFFSMTTPDDLIPGIGRPLSHPEGLELWGFLDDMEHTERHIKVETNPQSATIFLKTRSH